MKRLLLGLVLLALLVLDARATAAPLDGFEAYATRALADWQEPGAAIAVVHGGKVVYLAGLGVREVGKPARVDERTIFAIASLTKGFTAAAVGLLVDEQKLAWDDLGIAVLTNGPRIALPEALVSRAIDAFLGAPPKDWSGLRLADSRARRARQAELAARAEADRPRRPRPSLPLER